MDNSQPNTKILKYPKSLYKYDLNERQRLIAKARSLSAAEFEILHSSSACPLALADKLIENVIGIYSLPLGVATNFIIDGVPHLIPMVTEEPSVIAAASKAAKIAGTTGGFTTTFTDPIMIGQIQIINLLPSWKINELDELLTKHRENIRKIAQKCDPKLLNVGGGLQKINSKELNTSRGKMYIIEFKVNVKDAMGANIINKMAEAIASYLQPLIPGKILLRIVSNLAIHRIAKAEAIFDPTQFGGSEIMENLLDAYAFAEADPFRAVTHNKGIMNGISALALATGNDTRAIEAGAHAYASLSGQYKPLSRYTLMADGRLKGEIALPVPFGIIGGITNFHPSAKLALKILDIKSSEELGRIAAAVGLAQNFAAMLALVGEGIQQGHMKLHNKKKKLE